MFARAAADSLRRPLKAALVILLILLLPPVRAIKAQEETVTIVIPASADAGVHNADPNANNGTGDTLAVAGLQGTVSQFLLRFDLAEIPAGATISSAKLLLTPGGPGFVTPIGIYQLSGPWEEMSVTFATQPLSPDDPVLEYLVPQTVELLELDITPFVQSWVSGASANYGLAIVPRNVARSGVSFYSRDAEPELRPRLLVVFQGDPGTVPTEIVDTAERELVDVAYIDPDGNVILAREDGANLRQITSGTVNGNPQWSPDGLRLYYIRDPLADQNRLYMYDFVTGAETDITPENVRQIRDIAISPTSGQIVFSHRTISPFGEPDPIYGEAWEMCLARVNATGGIPDDFYCANNIFFAGLEVTPDGREVLVTEGYFEYARTTRVTFDGRMTVTDICCFNLSLHPNGDSAVATANNYFNFSLFPGPEDNGLFLINLFDWRILPRPILLRQSPVYAFSPDLSADAQRVVYSEKNDQGEFVAVLDIATGATRQITAGTEPTWRPSISLLLQPLLDEKETLFESLEWTTYRLVYTLPDVDLPGEGLLADIRVPALDEERSRALVKALAELPPGEIDPAVIARFQRLLLQEKALAFVLAHYTAVQNDIVDSYVNIGSMLFSTLEVAIGGGAALSQKTLEDAIDLYLLNTPDAELRTGARQILQPIFDAISAFDESGLDLPGLIIQLEEIVLEYGFREDAAHTMTEYFVDDVQPGLDAGVNTVETFGSPQYGLAGSLDLARIQTQDITTTVAIFADEAQRFDDDIEETLAWNELAKDVVDLTTMKLGFTWPASVWTRVQQVVLDGVAITYSWRTAACLRDYGAQAGQQIFEADRAFLPRCDELYPLLPDPDDWWPDWFDLPKWRLWDGVLGPSLNRMMSAAEQTWAAVEADDGEALSAAREKLLQAQLEYAAAVTLGLDLLRPPEGHYLPAPAQELLLQSVRLEMDLVGFNLLLEAYEQDPGNPEVKAMLAEHVATMQGDGLDLVQTWYTAPAPPETAALAFPALHTLMPHDISVAPGADIALPLIVSNVGSVPAEAVAISVWNGAQPLAEESVAALDPGDERALVLSVPPPNQAESMLTVWVRSGPLEDASYVWVYQSAEVEPGGQISAEISGQPELRQLVSAPERSVVEAANAGSASSSPTTEAPQPAASRQGTSPVWRIIGLVFVVLGGAYLGWTLWSMRS